MRPRIRYCATPAGRIAYSTAGAGPALLCDTGWITDLRAQLELFSFGTFMERLAERFTVIRYDKPGCGLSDRDGIVGAVALIGRVRRDADAQRERARDHKHAVIWSNALRILTHGRLSARGW